MDFLESLKELFSEQGLTYDQFSTAVKGKGYKLADLSSGNYVDKHKYDDAINTRDTSIKDLQTQIQTRDKDIKDLQDKLKGTENDATKVSELTAQLEKLQGDYDTAQKDFDARINKQSYEFAVREYANGQKFTSNAAKKQFISDMVSENLKMKDDTIIGADDYLKTYKASNEDSFIKEETQQQQQGGSEQTGNEGQQGQKPPTFVQPTPPQGQQGPENPFMARMSFTGVRPRPQQ